MNHKQIGEIGANCVIGDLSKYGLGIAVPLSDNLPYDLIVIANEKLFKVQVKSSTVNTKREYISFDLRTNNWLKGTSKKYTDKDCDIVICYDLVENKSFLLLPNDFKNKGTFAIRYKKPLTNNQYNSNWCEDYIISNKRIKEVFNFEVPDLYVSSYIKTKKKFINICQECKIEFEGSYKNAKFCSSKCKSIQKRIVQRPEKEELRDLIKNNSIVSIGRKFKVSDNAIRKWAKYYDINIKEIKVLGDTIFII